MDILRRSFAKGLPSSSTGNLDELARTLKFGQMADNDRKESTDFQAQNNVKDGR
jgi:hypothetical protein